MTVEFNASRDSDAAALIAEHEAVFGPHRGYRPPEYSQMSVASRYITMRDGVRIAIDVNLPAPLLPGVRLPALLVTTRYWRTTYGQMVAGFDKFFTGHGYAVVHADERGTGASFGAWPYLWSREAIADYGETAEWIAAQGWSNGAVGGIGISYTGTTAQLLAVPNHPAVKAVVPKFMEFDVYTDIGLPGGVPLELMIGEWFEPIRQMDLNNWTRSYVDSAPTIKTVDEDHDGSLLAGAIEEHRAAPDCSRLMSVTYRDETAPDLGVTFDDFSVHAYRNEIERSGVPVYGWGSWNDAATADAVIRRFVTFSNPQLAVIGPWNHGGDKHTSQYAPSDALTAPSLGAQWLEDLRFFDHYLKGVDGGMMDEKLLVYYTMGEERWKRTDVWPVDGASNTRWYLAAGAALEQEPPTADKGADRYEVNFEASTGETTRWHTEFNGCRVSYGDRAEADRRLLTYTSAALEHEVEITGYPVVSLFVTSTHADGAVFVYLEDVDPDGRVTYVTEGQLRAMHRKVSTGRPPYTQFTPYHTFKKADAAPLVPGEVAELQIGLQPTSVLIRKGHRIRIAVAGHDRGVFARVPRHGDPVITVERNGRHASFVDLPIIART